MIILLTLYSLLNPKINIYNIKFLDIFYSVSSTNNVNLIIMVKKIGELY